MADDGARRDEVEILCMMCNRPLTEDDDLHFVFGPYGYDLDVVCGECMARSKQSALAVAEGDGDGTAED